MCVDEVSRAREKCPSVLRTVRCSVFTTKYRSNTAPEFHTAARMKDKLQHPPTVRFKSSNVIQRTTGSCDKCAVHLG